MDGRLRRLEGSMSEMLRDLDEAERERRSRAITRWILDEARRLKASGVTGDLLECSVRRVVEDQYSDLGPESRQYIAEGWIETMREWTKLDWWTSAGRERPAWFV